MKIIKNLRGLIRFRYKLYYSKLKAWINDGSFVYTINDNVRFVCNSNDYFSQILFISNGHEKLEMEWCRLWLNGLITNKHVVDCGANIGFFSCCLAQSNPQVQITAIEGNKSTFNLLESNIRKLSLKNIKVINAILAESTEKVYQIPNLAGREPWQQAQAVSSSDVATITLSKLAEQIQQLPGLIKIDCEGFEVKILKGAQEILSKGETAFMIECNDQALQNAGTDRKELFELFWKNNYKIYHLASFGSYEIPGKEISLSFPSREFNFAAIPDKKEYTIRFASIINQLTIHNQ